LNFTKSFAKHKFLFIVLVLFTVIVLMLHLARGNLLIGDEPYFNLRIANDFLESGNIPNYDELSYGGRELSFPIASPILLGLFSLLSGVNLTLTAKILPFLLGLFSIILFYFILEKLNIKSRVRYIAVAMLSISPPFFYLSATLNSYSFVTFLSLLAFFLLLNNRKILASLSLIVLPFFNLILPYFTLIFVFFYVLKKKKNFNWLLITSFLMFFLSFSLYGTNLGYIQNAELKFFISDFGGQFGIGIFSFVLAFFALISLWARKSDNFLLYLLFLTFIFSTFYYHPVLFFFNFLIVGLAAYGLDDLIRKRWSSVLFKRFTLLLFIFGLFFSGLSYFWTINSMRPNMDDMKALGYLAEHSSPDETVFSYYNFGNIISWVTGRKNFIDTNFVNAPNIKERLADMNAIFHSRNRDLVASLLKKYNIDYVWLDEETIEELDLSDEEGLQLLVRYDGRFDKIYERNGINIWKFET